MGHVLKPGETQVPAGLAAGLSLSNKAQDSVLKHLTPDVTGNTLLAAVVADMETDGIDSVIREPPPASPRAPFSLFLLFLFSPAHLPPRTRAFFLFFFIPGHS